MENPGDGDNTGKIAMRMQEMNDLQGENGPVSHKSLFHLIFTYHLQLLLLENIAFYNLYL